MAPGLVKGSARATWLPPSPAVVFSNKLRAFMGPATVGSSGSSKAIFVVTPCPTSVCSGVRKRGPAQAVGAHTHVGRRRSSSGRATALVQGSPPTRHAHGCRTAGAFDQAQTRSGQGHDLPPYAPVRARHLRKRGRKKVEHFDTLPALQRALEDLDAFPNIRLNEKRCLGKARLMALRALLCDCD